MTRTFRWSPLALLGMLAVLVLVSWPTAQAGHFSGANSLTGCYAVNMADPNPHSVYYTADVGSAMRDALNATRFQDYDPTDVNTISSGDPNSGTDVVIYQADYSTFCGFSWHPTGGTVGATQCVSLTSVGKCQKHEIRFDTSALQDYGSTYSWFRPHMACHEFGHGLGMNHRTSTPVSCMLSGSAYEDLDQHDRDALNANY